MRELTKTEEIIMLTIWKLDTPITLSAVMEALDSDPRAKAWKAQTISTYFRKLVDKKYLKMNQNGKTYTYKVLVSREKYRNYVVSEILMYFFDSDKTQFIDAIRNV